MMRREWLEDSVGNLMTAEGVPSLWKQVFSDRVPAPQTLVQAADEALAAVDALPPLNLSSHVALRHLRTRDPLVRKHPGA